MQSRVSCLLFIAALFVGSWAEAPSCLHLQEHKLPDPESCRRYYHCKDGVPIHAKCPWYQLFDNVVMECQKMWIVDCNAIPPQFPPPAWGPSTSSSS